MTDYTLLQAGLGIVVACAVVVIVYPVFMAVDALMDLLLGEVNRRRRGSSLSPPGDPLTGPADG